jgi:hypothetical protein
MAFIDCGRDRHLVVNMQGKARWHLEASDTKPVTQLSAERALARLVILAPKVQRAMLDSRPQFLQDIVDQLDTDFDTFADVPLATRQGLLKDLQETIAVHGDYFARFPAARTPTSPTNPRTHDIVFEMMADARRVAAALRGKGDVQTLLLTYLSSRMWWK